MPKSVYIHIPFCKSKCYYCSFVSFDLLAQKKAYINALLNQIKNEYKHEKLNTLYIGGGTPSLCTIKELSDILNLFNIDDETEITIEINPDSVDIDYLSELRGIGFNRISIGAQTFNDKILNYIGRKHNSVQIFEAVKNAKNSGFINISLDFIYGLPYQKLNDFKNDLVHACDLNIQHISLYGLKIDQDCSFAKNYPKNLPDLDLQTDMYLMAVELLNNNSFNHYEISNFSLPHFESAHNLNYWNNSTYYGFGCSASGYNDNIRYTNEKKLDLYINNPLRRMLEHKLTENDILEETIFLGFRKIAGINIEEINNRFNIDFNNKYKQVIDKYSNFLTKTEKGWMLTLNGFLVSNEILSEFID